MVHTVDVAVRQIQRLPAHLHQMLVVGEEQHLRLP
jgi:hypothetical protein